MRRRRPKRAGRENAVTGLLKMSLAPVEAPGSGSLAVCGGGGGGQGGSGGLLAGSGLDAARSVCCEWTLLQRH